MANAGIHMKDIIYAVSAGKVGSEMILDLNMIEDNYSDSDMPMAISPKDNKILLLQMDGNNTKEELKKGVSMVLNAGRTITKMQRDALLEVYRKAETKVENGA